MRDLMPLQGERLALRPLRPEWAEAYFPFLCDPYILAMTESQPLRSVDETRDLLLEWQARPDIAAYGIFLEPGGELVGDTTLYLDRGEPGVAEATLLLGPASARGRGLAAEALSLVVTHAGAAPPGLGLDRLRAEILRANTPSLRLFERAGFRIVGEDQRQFYLERVLAEEQA
jgi:RimJ/RimL family protein N-acetyltransferase